MAGLFGGFGGPAVTLDGFITEAAQCHKHGWKQFQADWSYNVVCRLLLKNRNQIDGILHSLLSPKKHSLAYAYLVGFKGTNEKLDDPRMAQLFVKQVHSLILQGNDRQLCLCPKAYTDALRTFCELINNDNMFASINLLKRAIQQLRGSNLNMLTWAHAELVQLTVHTRCYQLALNEINQDEAPLIEIAGQNSMRSIDNLRFHYYSGLIYIGTKDYSKALESLSMALSAPSECLSMIQLEAYKKYILISLQYKQALLPLPRYTPGMLKRYYQKFCAAYLELSTAFPNGADEVKKVVEKNQSIYMRDYNYGLVKGVLKTLEKRAIKQLTSVYTRLSIDKVADLCGFDSVKSAKKLLVSMIRHDELSATFDANGVVTFSQSISKSDAKRLEKINEKVTAIVRLWNALDASQLDTKQGTRYIKKKLNIGGGPGGMGGDEMMQQMLAQTMGGMIMGGGFFRG